jgi:uncharacterized protein (TIGR03083 family)
MDPYAAAFVRSRSAVNELIESSSPEAFEQISPLTPEWRVRDVVAHLCGVSEDVLAGNLPTGNVTAWADAQVARHLDDSLEEIRATWLASGIENIMNELFAQMIFDQISHEFDIRYALGRPGDTSSDAVQMAARFAAGTLRATRPVRVEFNGEVLEHEGHGDAISVRCTSFELLRSLTGRRSWSQISTLDWSGDLQYVRELVHSSGIFRPTSFDVVE